MRPIRLRLRGFTTFRDNTVVQFEGRHLFAITGATGAGKSSLLDAMTWALYGEVARVGNRAAQLMTHGAVAMSAQFDFAVGRQRYRVSRSIGRKSEARLDRAMGEDTWEPVADRARDVSAEVTRVLGLDYDTFTKTVLLPQGAFDAFLRGDPGDRREILSGLLGLGVYERMRGEAHARAAGAQASARMQLDEAERLTHASPEALVALEANRKQLAARLQEISGQRATLAELTTLERAATEHARIAADAARNAEQATAAVTQAVTATAEATSEAEHATARLAALAAERTALGYDADEHRRLEQQAAQVQQRVAARADLARAQQALAEAARASTAAAAEAQRAEKAAALEQSDAEATEAALKKARTNLAAVAGPTVVAVAALGAQVAAAEEARAAAMRRSDEYEQKARTLQTLARQLSELRAEQAHADGEVTKATAAAATAAAARVQAMHRESAAVEALVAATAAREAAQREHAAAAILRELRVGDRCPVCGEGITSLAEHAIPDLDAADAALHHAEAVLAAARADQQYHANAAAAAQAHVEAARAAHASVDAKRAALETQCSEAGVALAGIDRAAKRASTAAAAEGERATGAEQRASKATTLQRELEILLARVPPEVEPAEAPLPTGSLTAALAMTLEAHAIASEATRKSADVARTAAETARGAHVAAAHAAALHEQSTAVCKEAAARLEALGAEAADAAALLAALAVAGQCAQRATEIAEAIGVAEQQWAAASTLAEERRAQVTRANEAAVSAAAACKGAATAAAAAGEAYATRWRALGLPAAPPADELSTMGNKLEADERDADRALIRTTGELERAERERVSAERLRAEAATAAQTADVATGLEQELHRNRFVAYVQREAMQVLASEAAERMEQLSRGRYRLRADGDEFVVVDRFNGDEQRSVKTLSGGETFLASLALSLALAERLPQLSGHGGSLSLESLFLDEGFGSLDADSLDVAIEALELLASGDRMIGVISHVPLIAERLPDRIEVMKNGPISTIRG